MKKTLIKLITLTAIFTSLSAHAERKGGSGGGWDFEGAANSSESITQLIVDATIAATKVDSSGTVCDRGFISHTLHTVNVFVPIKNYVLEAVKSPSLDQSAKECLIDAYSKILL